MRMCRTGAGGLANQLFGQQRCLLPIFSNKFIESGCSANHLKITVSATQNDPEFVRVESVFCALPTEDKHALPHTSCCSLGVIRNNKKCACVYVCVGVRKNFWVPRSLRLDATRSVAMVTASSSCGRY